MLTAVFKRRLEAYKHLVAYTDVQPDLALPVRRDGRKHAAHAARAYGLTPWESRPDVPTWAREIALVAAIHCQHWMGYVFNDYARVPDTLRWLAERIEGRHYLW